MSPAIANSPPYLPSEIRKAYGADAADLDGKDQTIGILIDTLPLDSDIEQFWNTCGIPVQLGRITKINVSGAPLPQPSGEETLDTEWTSGIATAANVRIYAAGSLQFTDLDRALDQIIDDIPTVPSMRQISISLGAGERYLNGPGGEVAVQDAKYLKLAAAGVNVFVSSGDAGSNPGEDGSSDGPTQADFAASDPHVVAVGGTSLQLGADGAIATEDAWSGSGGGMSGYFPLPGWQHGPGISGVRRMVPDVSAAADPEEGAYVQLNGSPRKIGGTSWSAPIWAGFCALINAERVRVGQQPLPYLSPLLYPLAGTACFRDITTGSNGAYTAVAGYDMVTGLGTPNVAELIKHLP